MLPKIIENRKVLLQNNDVLSKLGEIDLLITEKGVNIPIKDMDRIQATKILTDMSEKILLDIGIKKAEPYEIIRFVDVITKYYKRFSVNEIKLAFELLLIGELDYYLPKDRNGQADKNHYQSFSFEYISKVLRAYGKRRDKTWHKAHLALPSNSKKEPTEQDIKESRERFVNDIKTAFNKYKDSGDKTVIYIPAYWVDFLHKKGFIKVAPELTDIMIKDAYSLIIKGKIFLTEYDKRNVQKDYENGVINPMLKRKAQFEYYYNLIYEFFDFVIKNKEDLNELL
jgi:hypothetical protein